jgi:hypothetical protein
MNFSSLLILSLFTLSSAFVVQNSARYDTVLFDGDGTGGWGIGSSRELTAEEFARSDRSHFEGYQMRERGDFMQQIAEDKADMRKSEMEELLGVAAIAGLSVKSPSDRLNKFEKDVFDVDDDDLDLSV